MYVETNSSNKDNKLDHTLSTTLSFSYCGVPISQEEIDYRADDQFFDKSLLEVMAVDTEPTVPAEIIPVVPAIPIETESVPAEDSEEKGVDYWSKKEHWLSAAATAELHAKNEKWNKEQAKIKDPFGELESEAAEDLPSEDQEIISEIISGLSFYMMTADESVQYEFEADPIDPVNPIDVSVLDEKIEPSAVGIKSGPVKELLSDDTASVGTIASEISLEPPIASPVESIDSIEIIESAPVDITDSVLEEPDIPLDGQPAVVPTLVSKPSLKAPVAAPEASLLDFTAMTNEEKKAYLIEEKPELEYRTDLPEKRKIALNEEMMISGDALQVSAGLLREYCIGRPKLGKMKVTTERLFQLFVSNCIYYHNYWISVSLKSSKKYISINGIRRNPDIEIKIINYLSDSGFVELVKGDNYREAIAAGYKSELSRIKITPEAYEKYSHVKEFIEDDSVLSCSVFAKDVIKVGKDKKEFVFKDFRKSKMNPIGKKVYSGTLESVTNYNALLKEVEIINNGKIIPYEKKKVRVCFGITPDLETKGRWASSITNIKSELRKTYLINGFQTVERDFDCMHMSILMAKNRVALNGDFYSVPGYGPEYRKTIKNIVNISLNMPSFNGLHNNLKKLMLKYESELLSEYESSVYGFSRKVPLTFSEAQIKVEYILYSLKKVQENLRYPQAA
jgi:hypothetical protein